MEKKMHLDRGPSELDRNALAGGVNGCLSRAGWDGGSVEGR